MIIDYRIYCSLWALMLLLYISTLPMVRSRWWDYYFGGVLTLIGLLGLINYLDWLWS